jgi:hypothetical protein
VVLKARWWASWSALIRAMSWDRRVSDSVTFS